MSNIFKYCCTKDPNGSVTNLAKMNGHIEKCPFSESEVTVNNNIENNQKGKPNLRVKVPQPIRLKNHLLQDENFDVLHSNIEEVSNFVSTI